MGCGASRDVAPTAHQPPRGGLTRGVLSRGGNKNSRANVEQPNHKYQAHILEGSALFGQKKYRAALREFNRALELSPNNIRALYERGLCFAAIGGEHQEALDHARQEVGGGGAAAVTTHDAHDTVNTPKGPSRGYSPPHLGEEDKSTDTDSPGTVENNEEDTDVEPTTTTTDMSSTSDQVGESSAERPVESPAAAPPAVAVAAASDVPSLPASALPFRFMNEYYEKALADLEVVLLHQPTNMGALRCKADVALAAGRPELVVKAVTVALELAKGGSTAPTVPKSPSSVAVAVAVAGYGASSLEPSELRLLYTVRAEAHKQLGNTSEALDDLDAAAASEDEAKMCVVCMDAARNARIVPCLHAALCEDCAEELRKQDYPCPICSGKITGVERGKFLNTFTLDQQTNMPPTPFRLAAALITEMVPTPQNHRSPSGGAPLRLVGQDTETDGNDENNHDGDDGINVVRARLFDGDREVGAQEAEAEVIDLFPSTPGVVQRSTQEGTLTLSQYDSPPNLDHLGGDDGGRNDNDVGMPESSGETVTFGMTGGGLGTPGGESVTGGRGTIDRYNNSGVFGRLGEEEEPDTPTLSGGGGGGASLTAAPTLVAAL